MAKTKLILASRGTAERLLNEANEWYEENNEGRFESSCARHAIAEFLANKKGFTLFATRASYPTGDSS